MKPGCTRHLGRMRRPRLHKHRRRCSLLVGPGGDNDVPDSTCWRQRRLPYGSHLGAHRHAHEIRHAPWWDVVFVCDLCILGERHKMPSRQLAAPLQQGPNGRRRRSIRCPSKKTELVEPYYLKLSRTKMREKTLTSTESKCHTHTTSTKTQHPQPRSQMHQHLVCETLLTSTSTISTCRQEFRSNWPMVKNTFFSSSNSCHTSPFGHKHNTRNEAIRLR